METTAAALKKLLGKHFDGVEHIAQQCRRADLLRSSTLSALLAASPDMPGDGAETSLDSIEPLSGASRT